MNKYLLLFSFVFMAGICNAQNFKGQWKGRFVDKSISILSWGGNTCDYVIDLDVDGSSVSGYSYTYFTDGGKKYYTICKLKGFCDKKKKYVEVRETERTKTNVPVNISNSFQIHKLTWRKENGNQLLEGTWIPAPGQDMNNESYGTTVLSKRMLTEIAPLAKIKNDKKGSPERPLASARPTPETKKNNSTAKAPPVKPPVKVTTIKPVIKIPATTTAKLPLVLSKKDTLAKDLPLTVIQKPKEIITIPGIFEKRTTNILETVSVESPVVQVELYDNGEIDGDSVTLFFNNKILVAHKRLTEKAISIDLPIKDGMNELVMYADNLGTLPPNTALMIVHDGSKRYEVRITSDLNKSGTIRFVHKKPDVK